MLTAFMRTRCVVSAIAIALAATAVSASDSPPTATTAAGKLSGIHDSKTGLNEFMGIPYAAPPIGPLRWKPPQPVAAWTGVRQADHFGPRCMQRPIYSDMMFRSNGVSEDCLYLNVWTPAHGSNEKLPVLVYFYGGGFQAGDGSEFRYDGASLAQRGIVTVTISYRLNVFGFLVLPELAAESPEHATGNYGLLDQHAALRWVQANIAAFGGDPNQVTIGGESAGSMSVSAQMASPLSKGLMQRAIGESGAVLGNLKPRPLALAEQQGQDFEKRVRAHSLAQLRAMDANTLLDATGDKDVQEFMPTIDGYFFPRSPEAIYQAGEQAHIPLLVGSNSQEGDYPNFLDNKTPTPANYRAAMEKRYGKHADEALKLYPGHTEAEVKTSGTAFAGDDFIAFATWRWMAMQHKTGQAPVYYYYFTQARPAKRDGSAGPDAGAVHSGEIEFALGNLDSNHVFAWTAADHHVSAITQGYWANFIKTGNPNGAGLPDWPAVAGKDGGLLRQVIGADTRTTVDHNAARYQFMQRAEPDAHL
ncbi:carboxylesterase/lipase family protein [Dyella nitratireducens]|uniref:Carboxylic ester hydrolase n=1 Tax=Dyella nitratireducens TaxID=1849580 RepID=A0ABQ1FVA6_9GAMM|nr:carboxylesterase family protein [Dyella nitratireducens]GGA29831.1 carboxylic ester hydrolase [Dyella nitratireducens]GLQ43091.1 carboxylic ester hydrolase [Dyella nitratireducens]